ncbi:unnamed protein product [Paramecium octaurelia]|uniref:Uncharacterized protein n=1 Tax=Paramecium octaurelia TaxID=43137 RepID=A0A8S1W751_PAROT|nr:unnamed protein product [Paramecium octaurelia]
MLFIPNIQLSIIFQNSSILFKSRIKNSLPNASNKRRYLQGSSLSQSEQLFKIFHLLPLKNFPILFIYLKIVGENCESKMLKQQIPGNSFILKKSIEWSFHSMKEVFYHQKAKKTRRIDTFDKIQLQGAKCENDQYNKINVSEFKHKPLLPQKAIHGTDIQI